MAFYNKPFIILLFFFSLTLEVGRFSMALVHAEENSVTMLDPILVTGSANPTQLSHSTQSLTVIEREQYAPLQPNRIPSVLQQVPGLHIDEMGGRGGISRYIYEGQIPISP
jgi:outer membrane cobalamin receptor